MGDITADVVIVGAGFSGCLSLHHMRIRGFSAKIIEAQGDFGGVWNLNRYPGVRVDCEVPSYQLTSPEIFRDFSFDDFYPTGDDLRNYFNHIDERWNLREDTIFNQRVTGANYDDKTKRWRLTTNKGLTATARFVIFAVGTTIKAHIPEFPNLNTFQGRIIQPSSWPEQLDLDGKRIGVIGQGASGVQVFEQLAGQGHDVTVFVRTPPVAVPLKNRRITEAEHKELKTQHEANPARSKYGDEAGYPYIPYPKSLHDESPAQNQALMEKLWKHGGVGIFACNYVAVTTDVGANRAFYDFWVDKTRIRMADEVKKNILAPLQMVQPPGTKRWLTEENYYELMDGPNVTLVNLLKTPIKEFTANGIVTSDIEEAASKTLHELDVVIMATGYDSLTGSLYDMNITDKHGKTLQEKWTNGVRTSLGMMVPGMPNAFILYGPQAPTSLTTAPPFVEMQVEWIDKSLDKMEKDNIASVEPTESEADDWYRKLRSTFDLSLCSKWPSWWVGSNIPGKRQEPLIWFGGVKAWALECSEALGDWSRFHTE
ncbi:Baeyer-Villiger monooxygenase [Metarhizium anisopliae]